MAYTRIANSGNYGGLGDFHRARRPARRSFSGLGAFGKGMIAPPPTTPDTDRQLLEMQHKHEMEMMKLRMEMMAMMRQGQPVPQVIVERIQEASSAQPTSTAEASQVSDSVKALSAELEKLKREQQMAKEGGATVGTDLTKKELLAARGEQDFFMRSTKKPDANIHWKSWERLKHLIPANFNEAKYLANNPDVAAAVKQGAMPSGAYHYAMYGMGAGCHASQDPSGKGKCDTSSRSFLGYNRRPGYLSGIFSNWNQAGW